MFRAVPLSIIRSVSKPVWHTPLLCVQWKTPGDAQRNCPKHVEFYSKNTFQKLVHLVGFVIRIYHDARSPERQTINTLKTHPKSDCLVKTQKSPVRIIFVLVPPLSFVQRKHAMTTTWQFVQPLFQLPLQDLNQVLETNGRRHFSFYFEASVSCIPCAYHRTSSIYVLKTWR